jgi:hypothetical protein
MFNGRTGKTKIDYRMKQVLQFLILFGPLSSYGWQSNQDNTVLSREFPVASIEVLDLETKGLSLNLSTWEEEKIRVEVLASRDNKPLSWEDNQLKKKLEAYSFDLSEQGNRLLLRVAYEKRTRLTSGNDNIVLLIKIQCPKSMDSYIQTSGGSITLGGLKGKQQLNSEGGSIRILEAEGQISANSMGGSFFVDTFEGELELNSSGGSVRIDHFSGSLQANSSGGSMSLFDTSGKIMAESEGGSIRANFIAPLQEITLRSKKGSIDMVLPKNLGMDVSFSASIVVSNHLNFEGESKKTLVKGIINGGGIPVTATTSGANVRVDYY